MTPEQNPQNHEPANRNQNETDDIDIRCPCCIWGIMYEIKKRTSWTDVHGKRHWGREKLLHCSDCGLECDKDDIGSYENDPEDCPNAFNENWILRGVK